MFVKRNKENYIKIKLYRVYPLKAFPRYPYYLAHILTLRAHRTRVLYIQNK